jgi:hypothetical protein
MQEPVLQAHQVLAAYFVLYFEKMLSPVILAKYPEAVQAGSFSVTIALAAHFEGLAKTVGSTLQQLTAGTGVV